MFLNSSRRVTWLITALLGCTASLSTPAEPKDALPEVVYLEQEGMRLRIDYSDYLQHRGELMEGDGCYRIVVSASPDSGDQRFLPDQRLPDVPADSWFDIWKHEVCFDGKDATVADTAGPDTVRFQMPPDGAPVRVSVNGHDQWFPQPYVDQLAAAVAAGYLPPSLMEDGGMVALASHLDPDGWYTAALPVVVAAQRSVGDRFRVEPHAGPLRAGCWKPCLNCAANSGGLLVAVTAVAASCGATAGAGCVAGGVGIMRLAVGTVSSCSDCLECRRAGGGGAPCEAGYHDCCEGMCCSDQAPPPDCGPEEPRI